jgi:hypothetical protein
MRTAPRDTPFFQIGSGGAGEWRQMMNNVMAGHGAIGCDEEAPLQRAEKLDDGPGPQIKLADPNAGEVGQQLWSPNRVTVHLKLERDATVTFNQNWNEHWKSTVGQVVRVGPKVARDKDGGRLGVAVPAGEYDLQIYYLPRSFVVGATVSLVTWPLAIGFWFWRRKRSRRGNSNSPA